MKNIKNAMQAAKAAEKACDMAEAAWAEFPESEELEAVFDASYKAQHEAEEALFAAIENFAGGAIDAKTARLMWMSRREQLEGLINRAA